MNFTFIRNPKEFGNICGFSPRQSQSSHRHTDTHNNEHILRVQKYKEQRLEIGPQPTTVLCNETVYPDVCQGICCGIKVISRKITKSIN